ncbi:hypothetical protein DXG01_017184 [Tephrocybe rancida]|nr:hypothetical protein DXG01_017184 [Tephrocybe rancida]
MASTESSLPAYPASEALQGLAPLALENVQVQIMKALRAEGKMDVRLLVSEPSASTWDGQAPDRRDLGASQTGDGERGGGLFEIGMGELSYIHGKHPMPTPHPPLHHALHLHPPPKMSYLPKRMHPSPHIPPAPPRQAQRPAHLQSDESKGEDNQYMTYSSVFPRAHPLGHILEEEEHAKEEERVIVASRDETADALLELDVNLLKTELGNMAFGKRMRIANAITDLRRPSSVGYSDHAPHTNSSIPISPAHSQGHLRHQSRAYSHHSLPGSFSGVPAPAPGQEGVGQVYIGPGVGGMMYSPETGYAPSPEQVYSRNRCMLRIME